MSQATSTCGDGCSSQPAPVSHRERVVGAARSAGSFFLDMLPYLVIGMVAGALVHGVVPVDWLQAVLGSGNPFAVPVAAVAGAPVYLSMSAMLPLAGALAEQGIPIGTVLAFVVGGAGVSIPNVILLAKLFDRALLAVYVGVVVSIGILVGFVFNVL